MCAQLTPTKSDTKSDEPSSPVFSYKKSKKREKNIYEEFVVNQQCDISKNPKVDNKYAAGTSKTLSSKNEMHSTEDELNPNTNKILSHSILYSNIIEEFNCSETYNTNTSLKKILSYARDLESANVADKSISCIVNTQIKSPGFKQFSILANTLETQIEDKFESPSNAYLTDSELLTTTDLLQDFATKAIDFSQWNYQSQILGSSNERFKIQRNCDRNYRTDKRACGSKKIQETNINLNEDNVGRESGNVFIQPLQISKQIEDNLAINTKRKFTSDIKNGIDNLASTLKTHTFKNIENNKRSKMKDTLLTCNSQLPNVDKQKTFSMFSMASGKTIGISEENFQKAKGLFEECDDLLQLNTKKRSMHVQNTVAQKCCPSALIKEFQGFQTASGKSTVVSEEALSKGRTLLHDDNMEDISKIRTIERDQNGEKEFENLSKKMTGFQTASGKNAVVSEESLLKARTLLDDDNTADISKIRTIAKDQNLGKEFNISSKTFHGFQTASGKSTIVSEEALLKARTLLDDDNMANISKIRTIEKDQNREKEFENLNKKITGFQTASGKNAIVSEESLSKARTLLDDDNTANISKIRTIAKDQNLGKEFNISNKPFQGFQTASGKSTKVSEEALLKARTLLDDDNMADISKIRTIAKDQNLEKEFNITNKPFQGFQTASGKSTKVSEEALLKARTLLDDDNTANISKIRTIEQDQNGEKEFENLNKKVTGFQTASGKNAIVSEESLLKARTLLDDDNTTNISKIRTISIDQNVEKELKTLYKKIPGFQTASGKSSIVSVEALQKARTLLEDDFTTDTRDNKTISIDQNGEKELKNCNKKVQTAGGKNAIVSEKALLKARTLLDDNYTTDTEEIKNISKENHSVEKEIKNSNQNFQSATGKNEIVLEEQLIQSRTSLKDKTTDDENGSEFNKETMREATSVVWKFNKNNSNMQQNDQVEVIEIKDPGSPILMKNPILINKRRSKIKNDNKNLKETFDKRKGKSNSRPITLTQEIAESTTALLADELCFDKDMFEGSLITSPSNFLFDVTEKSKPLILDDDMSVKEIDNSSYHFNKKLDKNDIFFENFNELEANRVKTVVKSQETSTEASKSTFKIPYKPGATKVVDNTLKRSANDMNLEYSTPFAKKCKQSDSTEDEDQLLVNDTQIVSKLDEREISDETKLLREMEYEKQKSRIKYSLRRKIDCKPLKGSCLTHRITSANRLSWANCTRGIKPQNFNRDILLYRFHVKKSIINICSANVEEFFFSAWDYYSISTCKTNTSGILCGDGAVLVLDGESNITLDRITTAFLTSPGVDSTIVNEAWVRNHFKWIILKLSAMERSFPMLFSNRACTPNNLMLQLKYRYDREIDSVERSCIKRILQADDTAAKPMILYCADIYPFKSEESTSTNKALFELELSDGWYSVRTKIDALMSQAISNNKLKIGDKIYMVGSHLLNCSQGCDPLEVPSEVRLQIFSNSCTRARWDSRLGYLGVAPMLPCLGTVHPLGGLVYLTDFIVVRRYPTVYLVKHNGKTTLHSEKLEMKLCQQYEKQRSIEAEKVYSQVRKSIEYESMENERKKGIMNENDISKIRNPDLLFDLMAKSHDPLSVQNLLSDSQKSLISEYYARKQSDISNEIENRVREIMSKSNAANRSSSQLLKVRVMPICRDNKPEHKRSVVLSIWRPNSSIFDILKEKSLIRANNCTAESIRNGDLQLSAGRQASFKTISSKYFIQQMYPFRTYTSITDMYCKDFNPAFNEIDTVGVVIHISPWHNAHSFQTVYLADLQQKVIGVSFWGGVQHHGYEQVIKTKSLIACSNLQWRNKNGKNWIPNTYVTDMSTFSSNPRQEHLKEIFENFKTRLEHNIDEFVLECEENLSKSKTSMSSSRTSFISIPSPLNNSNTSATPVTPIQKKISILSMVPEPPKLSPIPFTTPKKRLSKPFKPPTRIHTNIDNNLSTGNEIAKHGHSPPLSLE